MARKKKATEIQLAAARSDFADAALEYVQLHYNHRATSDAETHADPELQRAKGMMFFYGGVYFGLLEREDA